MIKKIVDDTYEKILNKISDNKIFLKHKEDYKKNNNDNKSDHLSSSQS